MKITTTKDIYVSSSFTERFGNKDITPAKEVLPFQKLSRAMTDDQIEKELSVKKSTLADVAAFLKDPPKGCDDGNWNLFYVDSFVVDVFWGSWGGYWGVSTYERGDGEWYDGVRVFSPATEHFETSPSSESLILPEILEINGVKYKRI